MGWNNHQVLSDRETSAGIIVEGWYMERGERRREKGMFNVAC